MPPAARNSILIACFLFLSLWTSGLNPSAPQAGQVAASKPPEVGIAVGASAPAFKTQDQFGQEQDSQKIAGKNGTVLLFYRSADW